MGPSVLAALGVCGESVTIVHRPRSEQASGRLCGPSPNLRVLDNVAEQFLDALRVRGR